jgi:proteasome accessory factor A
LHVIAGDANMSEVATLLKLGSTSIVLAMIEDDAFPEHLIIKDPVHAIRQVSHDTSLSAQIMMTDGRMLSALQIQLELIDAATVYAARYGLESVDTEVGNDVLVRWAGVLDGLGANPFSVANIVDWLAKKRIVDGFAQRHGLQNDDARLKAIDLQYHDMRLDKCLALRAGLDQLFDHTDVAHAMINPPKSTRAYFRGTVLQRWPNDVIAANWDSVVFDIPNQGLKRIPMPEPLRGTRNLVGKVLSESRSPSELIEKLSSDF